ncbi:alanine:glyoxylate aminotransferase, putative [Medicago truncatula]|uniref:Alanine:glyoxylate aminotransferase, putative n=1 Tax=Medicago truncatula TaxID=3880 RepID=G7L4C3_MEDTR|nr:alanine:glyoxylate aminotransferase, putative [Medicago truncatula]
MGLGIATVDLFGFRFSDRFSIETDRCPALVIIAYVIHIALGLCIANVVQSRFDRNGSIGNGIPLGVVVTTPKIAKVLTHLSYFNNFVGSNLKERLNALKDKHECKVSSVILFPSKINAQERAHVMENKRLYLNIVVDVRGKGLVLEVEHVIDCELKTPAKDETLHVIDQMKGLLIRKGGYYRNVFEIHLSYVSTKKIFRSGCYGFLVDAMDYTLDVEYTCISSR